MPNKDGRKSVLITGCSPGGIGHALARQFHAKGLQVIATARTKETISDLEEMGMTTLSLNVTSTESIATAKMAVEGLTGSAGLDILVNNAGRTLTVPALEALMDEIRKTFETNLFAVIEMTQVFTPLLIMAKGLIVNIGSVAAIVPYVFGSVYNASKAALHAYSQTLRLELEPFDVRVMVVITGGVQSRIARTDRELGYESLYLDIEDEFRRRVKHSQEGAMRTDVYAKGVVTEALRGSWRQKKWVWRGNKTWLVWFVSNFVGSWFFDLILPRMFGLDRLRRLVKGKAKKA